MRNGLCIILAVLMMLSLSGCGSMREKQDFGKIGSVVTFGSYEQDNKESNGKEPIQWIVLDVKDDRSLLLSKKVLDSRQFQEKGSSGTTWEKSSMREWLNSFFLNEAFSAEERDRIPEVTVTAGSNPFYPRTAVGKDTDDKVFLLSLVEALTYFTTDSNRACKPTEYAKAQGVFFNEDSGNCIWCLRTPATDLFTFITYVSCTGDTVNIGDNGTQDDFGVRPAIWVNQE